MKKVILFALLIFAIIPLVSCVGTVSPQQVDREIIGKIAGIDRGQNYSTFYFVDGLTIKVSNESLNQWIIGNIATNTLDFKFQETELLNVYDLIGIGNDWIKTPIVHKTWK